MNSSERPFTAPLATEHAALTKHFGEVFPEHLLSLAERAEDALRTPNAREHQSLQRIKHHEIAADAYFEAALTLEDPAHEHDDTRMGLIETALAHYGSSHSLRAERMEMGFDDPYDLSELIRLDVRKGMRQLYNDIICGELTDQTLHETDLFLHDTLLHINSVQQTLSEDIAKGYGAAQHRDNINALRGFAAELHYVRSMQSNTPYLETAAFLSTVRGGSGNKGTGGKLSSQTHDVVVATRQGEKWDFQSVEIKRQRRSVKNLSQHLGRYSSRLVYMTQDGKPSAVFDAQSQQPA